MWETGEVHHPEISIEVYDWSEVLTKIIVFAIPFVKDGMDLFPFVNHTYRLFVKATFCFTAAGPWKTLYMESGSETKFEKKGL